MPVTAKQIAKELNLSQTAVSMALNGKPGVSTATRRLIVQKAEEMGYDFERIRSRSVRTGDICCVICRTKNAILRYDPIFSELITGMEQECERNFFRLKTLRINGEEDDILRCIEELRVTGCDGIVLVSTELSPDIARRFLGCGIPTVLVDASYLSLNLSSVLIDNIQGSYLASSYLIEHYGTQPGHLVSTVEIPNFRERRYGYERALQEHGMSTGKSICHVLPPNIDGAFTDMLRILDDGDPLARCYVADNDLIAIGVIKALRLRGLSVPDDVAVIGFDNITEGKILDPALTTVDVPRNYMGKTACRQLLYEIRSTLPHHLRTLVNVTLVKRMSA